MHAEPPAPAASALVDEDASSDMDDPQRRTRADTWWLAALTGAVILTGMAYCLWWADFVRHQPFYWVTPGDMWFSVRTAHWIGWGSFSFVYSNQRSALVTLPGFELLLTPVVLLSSALHLSEHAPGLIGPGKPTAWLLVGPLSLACSGVPLFALDALARRLGILARSRRVLSVAVAAALWSGIAIWGHPEDALALGADRLCPGGDGRRSVHCGGMAPRRRPGDAALRRRAGAPVHRGRGLETRVPAVLARGAVIPGLPARGRARPRFSRRLLRPRTPTIGPDAQSRHTVVGSRPQARTPTGGGRSGPSSLRWGRRRGGDPGLCWRRDLWRIVWLASAVLAARTVFEPVMVAYYVIPGLALSLVAARRHSLRWLGVCLAGAGLTVMTFTHHGPWEYWLALVGLTVAVLALAWPAQAVRQPEDGHVPAAVNEDVPMVENGDEVPVATTLR